MDSHTVILETPIGALAVTGSEAGISEIRFLDEPASPSDTIPPELAEGVRQLTEYFAGQRREFTFELAPRDRKSVV